MLPLFGLSWLEWALLRLAMERPITARGAVAELWPDGTTEAKQDKAKAALASLHTRGFVIRAGRSYVVGGGE